MKTCHSYCLSVQILALASLGFTSSFAVALECIHEAPSSDKALDADTSLGIGAIKRVLAEVKIGFDVRGKQVEIYSNYPKADQLVMNHNFMFMICTSLRDDKSITPRQRTEELFKLRREIFAPAVAIPLVPSPNYVRPVIAATAPPKSEAWAGTDRQYRATFLKPPPSVVTNENRYFVVAASPATEAEANSQYMARASTNPNIDLVIFAPYGSNNHYSLMMGTWLSKSAADRVIRIAVQLGIQPKPYLWRLNSAAGEATNANDLSEPSASRRSTRVNPKTLRSE